ncbi:MAG: hypothetical protein RSA65_00835 [Clostridia bacterium]
MKKSRAQRVAMNTTAGFASKLLGFFVQFFLRAVFIRSLGIEYSGVSSLFTSILSMLSLAELGLGSAITFALYTPLQKGDMRQVARLMNFYRLAYRLVAALVFFGGLCLVPFLDLIIKDVPNIKENITLLYVLYLFQSASSYLLIYRSALLTASQSRYIISIVESVTLVVSTVVEVILLLVFRNFLLYLLACIVFNLLRNIVTSLLAKQRFTPDAQYAHEHLPPEEKRAFLLNVAAMAMYNIAKVAIKATDDIVISSMLGTAIVGFVGNYKIIRSGIDGMIDQFHAALIPSVGNLATTSEGNAAGQYRVFQTVNFLSFWVCCCCCCAFFVLMDPFIADFWLGASYVMPAPIKASIILDFYIANMLYACGTFRNANGLFVQGKWCPAIMAAINVVLSFALVKPLGAFGVLIATAISRIVTQFWYDPRLLFRKLFNRPLREYFVVYLQYAFITLICCAASYGLASLVPNQHKLLHLAALALICLIIPNGVICLLYHRTPQFQYCKAKLLHFSSKACRTLRRKGEKRS